MRAFSLVILVLLIASLSCGAQTSRGTAAVRHHATLVKALLNHHAQQRERFARDPRMLEQMDHLGQELLNYQAPRTWKTLKGDRLLEAVARDVVELCEIFEKRLLDLGLNQPFALIPPNRRNALETLATLYKGYLSVLAPYQKSIRALETQAAQHGAYFPVLPEEA